MTDQDIIQGLIARDNRVTEEFFFVKCKPLFFSIMKLVFDYEVESIMRWNTMRWLTSCMFT